MPLPAAWSTVPVTWDIYAQTGSTCNGVVVFTTTQAVTCDGDTFVPDAIEVVVTAGVMEAVSLPATDDPDISPTGWTWKVWPLLTPPGPTAFEITVPVASSGINLATVIPIDTPEFDALALSDAALAQIVADPTSDVRAVTDGLYASDSEVAAAVTAEAIARDAEVTAAVATEATARTTADTALSARVSVVEGDYQTATGLGAATGTLLGNEDSAVGLAFRANSPGLIAYAENKANRGTTGGIGTSVSITGCTIIVPPTTHDVFIKYGASIAIDTAGQGQIIIQVWDVTTGFAGANYDAYAVKCYSNEIVTTTKATVRGECYIGPSTALRSLMLCISTGQEGSSLSGYTRNLSIPAGASYIAAVAL